MKKIRGLIWVLIIIAGTFLVYSFVTSADDKPNQEGEFQTQKVRLQDISASISATGIIKPQVGAEVKIGARASGRVDDLFVNIGDFVKKGQLLAKIDASELNAKYNQALANLDYAETILKYGRIEFERIKKLNDKEYVSQKSFDEAERAVAIAETVVMKEKSNVEYSKIQLDFTKIFASTSGVISSVSTQKGETVAASFTSPTFVTIIDLKRLEVWAYVDETDIGRIEIGQKAVFTVDTYSETKFTGTVTAIYPQAEIQNNVVNYITIIKIDPVNDKVLRPEMTASVNVYMEERKDVLTVPGKALKRRAGKCFVKIIKNTEVVEVEIKTGLRQNGYVEVLKGLSEKDEVVIN